MLDRHEAHDNLNQKVRDQRDASVSAERPVADREVPLPGMHAADGLADMVQMWLDGEAKETDARQSNDKAVEFWMRVQRDADRMHQTKAPAHLAANIMAALAPKAPLAD